MHDAEALAGDDFYPLRKCQHPGGCVAMAVKADDAAPEGAARCWFHGPNAPTGPSDAAFDAPDPDRAPRLAQVVDWVREGEECEAGGRLYLPRTPRGPRDPL